jgi:hypothetical protein
MEFMITLIMFRRRYICLRDHEKVGVLSVPVGILAAMATDLPPRLHAIAAAQHGMVSCAQIAEAGLTRGIAISRVKRGSWRRIHRGVYATFSGDLSREAALWAAVLYAGPGAMLSHQTAAELWKLVDVQSSLIHVTVPGDRRVRRRAGLAIHLSSRASSVVHPSRNPPRTRLEETVLDLWDAARSLDEAVGWVTGALGRRLTTQSKLREAMQRRSRMRLRKHFAELLSPDAVGIHSVLEYRYVRYVERPHGLAGAKRQVRTRRDGRTEYRDQLYEAYGTAVELDGRAAHPGDTRWTDIRRDNAAATIGITTLRYGWRDVTTAPCRVAAEIAEVLAVRGYARARPCSVDCPVGRQSATARSAESPLSQPKIATCRVPTRAGRRTRASGPRARRDRTKS